MLFLAIFAGGAYVLTSFVGTQASLAMVRGADLPKDGTCAPPAHWVKEYLAQYLREFDWRYNLGVRKSSGVVNDDPL